MEKMREMLKTYEVIATNERNLPERIDSSICMRIGDMVVMAAELEHEEGVGCRVKIFTDEIPEEEKKNNPFFMKQLLEKTEKRHDVKLVTQDIDHAKNEECEQCPEKDICFSFCQFYSLESEIPAMNAAAFFFPTIREKIANTIGSCYVMFPNILSCIIFPENEIQNPFDLLAVVKETNRKNGYDNMLSDSVYYFDAECKDILFFI